MGIISRHAGAPFADGETLAGADLEGDFATVYDAVNGNLESANLADDAVTTAKILDGSVTANKIATGAVTTAKLADGAVTQAKMTDGAASASESVFHSAAVTLTAAYVTLTGATISHTVGDPARHVVLQWSLLAGPANVAFAIFRDTVMLADSETFENFQTVAQNITKFFIDTTPTPGATHTYELKGKYLVASGTLTVSKIAFFAFEPRS